jgi:hypothetical protein
MSPFCSSRASALLLSLCSFSEGWVLLHQSSGHKSDKAGLAHNELRRHSHRVGDLGKRQEEELDCSENRYQQFLDENPPDRIQTFCNEILGMGPATTVIEYTPTMSVLHHHCEKDVADDNAARSRPVQRLQLQRPQQRVC